MNNNLKEDYFVNYAVRGCQQQSGMCNRSYVSGQPLQFEQSRTAAQPWTSQGQYFGSYPSLYGDQSCSSCYSKRTNTVMYPQLGYRQSVAKVDPSAFNAAYVNPSSAYVYVEKQWTAGS
jgi:hypothetical protein